MTDPTKVYLVVSGAYSDYSVSCAFTTYDLATEYAASMNEITPDEQRAVADAERLNWTEHKAALEALPKNVRRVSTQDGYRVEAYDLFDSVPVNR